MSAFPRRDYDGILSFPTKMIYALTACVGLQRSMSLGGSRYGITSSLCYEAGPSKGASDARNGQQGGNNISESICVSIFLLAMLFLVSLFFYFLSLGAHCIPSKFTTLFLPITSTLSLAPQEPPLPPSLTKRIKPLLLSYQRWWHYYPTQACLSCTYTPHPNQCGF